MVLIGSFARPIGLFDNWFNKVTAVVTGHGGNFCHSEFIFSFTMERMKQFLSYVEEDLTTWEKKLERYEEDGMIHICFFIVWGSDVSYRLLKYSHNNPYFKYPNENEFSLVTIKNLSDEDEFRIGKFLMDQMKKEYDYYGALTFFVPMRNQEPTYNRWFCSQLMVASLQHINRLKNVNPGAISPNHLYKLLLVS